MITADLPYFQDDPRLRREGRRFAGDPGPRRQGAAQMRSGPTTSHGVMEGNGAYNKHAKLQAGGAALALPLLENAVRKMTLDLGDFPIVIADYGSSQGKNSLAPMRVAISALRTRLGPNRPILVSHVDLPSNDFNTLFQVLDSDPDTYVLDEPNVFPCAIGRSFYGKVFPPHHVHLGWSSYAAVWLSRIPMLIPGHFFVHRSSGSIHAAFARQSAQDWEAFLSLRARELRAGGRLVVVLPTRRDDGSSGFEDIMDHANAVLAEMVDEGAITTDERAGMVLGGYARRRRDLLAPFMRDGRFRHLIVEHCDVTELEDAAWTDYRRGGNAEALASKQALFFRSTFVPSLASALARAGDAERCRAFGDRVEEGLKRRLARRPAAIRSLVGTIVLAKLDSA